MSTDVLLYFLNLVNLALGRPCRQSTEDAGGAAGLAVDGNTSPIYGDGSCTHTMTHNHILPHWWGVELETATYVHGVDIYNRNDACKHFISWNIYGI